MLTHKFLFNPGERGRASTGNQAPEGSPRFALDDIETVKAGGKATITIATEQEATQIADNWRTRQPHLANNIKVEYNSGSRNWEVQINH